MHYFNVLTFNQSELDVGHVSLKYLSGQPMRDKKRRGLVDGRLEFPLRSED